MSEFDSKVLPKARAANRLTAAMVRNASLPGKYFDGGGLGLFLRVEKNGTRFWVQRITINRKRHELGLGSPPVVTLAMARDAAMDNKRMIRSGGDPLAQKAKRKTRPTMTFARAVETYLEAKTAEFRNDKHRKQWYATLNTYALPVIGDMRLEDIEARDVLRVLEPIWTTKTETASRLRGRIEAVLSWATVAGHRKGDNPARWKGNLSELLAKPSKVRKGGNHAALALKDAQRWWTDLTAREGMASYALQFVALTAARSGEVRGMTWSEVDLKSKLWTVPAARMKAGKEHRVPLSKPALAVLQKLPRLEGEESVFFAPKGGALSDMALSALMRRMQNTYEAAGEDGYVDARSGRPAVPHGLRSTFRDWAAEAGVDHQLAEMALAHTVGSEVERAYRRTDLLERRRDLMENWAKVFVQSGNKL